jgi:O-acetyl-ADP-ribose deacetylase (regulator of RNase III)
MSINALLADITTRADEAIVNVANECLLAGSGVCGAIHRAAGPELEKHCIALAPCPTGAAVITPGFKLAARFIIHAVGPRWYGGSRDEPTQLADCYASIFALVERHGIRSIAVPAISTGIYNYPAIPAAKIVVHQAQAHLGRKYETAITFACFDQATLAIYENLLV